tara:strand:- start:94 stop:444 length:351 start_codon:yes stop_codon:yes gene_type:complete
MGKRERINIAPKSGTSRFNGGPLTETLTGTRTITEDEINKYQFFNLDPGGGSKSVLLPAEAAAKGALLFIANTADNAEVLSINNDASGTICTPTENEVAIVWCDGTNWHGIAGAES